ncbi:MAG: cyclic pyranopterin monophosphate synthase MoaC [Planctomycetota bacterium]|nr:cyclic pyranopterin monophosphate synthase MoaC [Planctomycetota bacterium]
MADMVDVGGKVPSLRTAIAEGRIFLRRKTLSAIRRKRLPKGDAVTIAKLAATSAVKATSTLIPLCHPLPIDSVKGGVSFESDAVCVTVSVSAVAKTGVEMEALTGVMAALLNIWDVAKQLEKDESGNYPDTRIEGVRVVEKKVFGAPKHHLTATLKDVKGAVLTVSSSRTLKTDEGGALIESLLLSAGVHSLREVVTDDVERIKEAALRLLKKNDFLVVTGGTGVGKKDVTPEAITPLFEKRLDGFAHIFAKLSSEQVGTAAILSRSTAGVIDGKPVFVIPGSPKACELAVTQLIIPQLPHLLTELNR